MAAKGEAKNPEPATAEGAITFEDLGIPTGDRGVVRTPVGQRRSLKDVTTLEWIFLVLSSLSIVVVIALTIIRLVELLRDSEVAQPTPSPSASDSTDTVFAILLLFNAIYILLYVLNGVFGERPNELLIFVAGICIVLVYCIINYFQPGTTSQQVKLLRYENKHLTWIFFATSIFEPAYIIYKIVMVAQDDTAVPSLQLLNYAILVCSVLGLLVRIAVVLCMSKVYSNFGKGLKEKAFGDEADGDTQPIHSS
nr:uncharacterized protein LOC129275895 [Lytechinus pictus]